MVGGIYKDKIMNISEYLISALAKEGVTKIFGIPGDYIISLFSEIDKKSNTDYVITTREDGAAFAADGYARCKGLGAVAVTYGVGGLNIVNAIAGAMSEMSPVIVISGAPGVTEQDKNLILHHKFGPYSFQRDIFSKITCYTTVLDDPNTAEGEIQKAILMAKRHSRPVYIEIPRDMLLVEISKNTTTVLPLERIDQDVLEMATIGALRLIYYSARMPVILAGIELHRFKLWDELNTLQRKTGFPIASTISGKSVFNEKSPFYLGVYGGAIGSKHARKVVEKSDCLIMLGGELNDVDTGIYTATLPENIIRASGNSVCINGYTYSGISTKAFVRALTERIKMYPDRSIQDNLDRISISRAAMIFDEYTLEGRNRPDLNEAKPTDKITLKYLIKFLNSHLPDNSIVVADTGDSLFAGLDLEIPPTGIFLASGFYTTMGFGVPAALGAALAKPTHKVFALIGDGAFQMTGTEISTIAKLKPRTNPVIFVINNDGYNTERFIIDGEFNDVHNWNYEGLQHTIPGIKAYRIETVSDLLNASFNDDKPVLMNVVLDRTDASESMKTLAAEFAKRLKPKEKPE